MSIQEQKLNIISHLLKVNDLNVLKRVEFALEEEETLNDYEKASIKRGLKQLSEGKRIPHKEVKKLYAKWL